MLRNIILTALLLASLLGVTAPTASSAESFTVQAGAFVEGFQDFVTVASGVDPADGTTYIVGRNSLSQAVLRKYDSSGGRLIWEGGTSETATLTQINPSGMSVSAGSTNLYLVGGRVVLSLSKQTGLVVDTADANAAVDLKGIYYWNNLVYVCGQYTSGTPFGHAATPRGSTSGLLIRMNANLIGGALALTTYGGNAGGTTAESVVVDEAGDAYVAGHMGSGSFGLDGTIDLPGKWKVTVVKTDTAIAVSNLEQATNLVLNGANATSTNTAFYDVINFGRYPTDGRVGGNDGFPGGWSERFALHASGSIWVNSPQSITFNSVTDDGTQLRIDGSAVSTYDGNRGAGDLFGSKILTRGLHSVDFIMWNQGGDSSAELWLVPNQNDFNTWKLLRSTALPDTQNKGYVLKFNGTTFSSLKNAYFTTTESAGQGGSFHQLNYSQGFVYAIGSWNGTADNPAIGRADASSGGSDIDIVKLDTALQLKARATVKGLNSNEGYGITADEAGNAYVTGSYGPASADFFGSTDSADRPYAHLSASSISIFVAKLDPNFIFQWVNKPSDPPPSFSLAASAPKVTWSPGLQRLFWVGYFGNNTLTLGQPNATISLVGPESFVAVLDPDGKFTERVNLTVVSEFGLSGTQIKPFGGPALSTNSPRTAFNTRPLIKGAQVAVTVPKYLYRDVHSNDITFETQFDASLIESRAETRLTSEGYSVDDNVVTGTGNTYIFTLTKDTIVKFGWTVEHALRIQRDPFGTEGTDSPDTPGHILGLKSDAAGTPEPDVNKHWILQNQEVIAQINAEEADLAYVAKGLPIKYVVTGYNAFGPPNTAGAAGQTNFIPFVGSDRRFQISAFTMTGPAVIRYVWKLKIGIQVNTTGFKSAGYPLIYVQNDPGSQPPTQPDGAGSGIFYFDENSRVQVGSLASETALQLKGWLNGDGIFASAGKTNTLTAFTRPSTNGIKTYLGQYVDKLTRPGRVMWDYGDRIFDETVYIGNPLTFGTVSEGIKPLLIMDQAPDRADMTEGPQGSSSSDMAIWDATGKKYYPLRPGILTSYWKMTSDPEDRIIIRITIKYADAPHYRHIANTPPVNLDPATNDLVRFKEMKYTESTTGAGVDSSGMFTATGKGKTVLLFGMVSTLARQGQLETLRVRVVETKNWNDQFLAAQPADIGHKITSTYDTAQLDSGFIVFTNARYNPFIYDREHVRGPIIPVNIFPNATEANRGQFVVVWYENRDKILWPYQPARYDPVWPTAESGLQRIVIASRYGSESVASNGTDQLVMPATGTAPNVIPEEASYNPVRFQQVRIYNQPATNFPGYNPNEEHALVAPSLRYADVSPRPVAAYALRDNDLNVTNRDASYTSDPYVLVQFFDAIDKEFKMKV
ncbi:MAG: Cadherin, partial [Verrucomicrobiales bacterium]|nr:Cadherin [Verrucomicrobiales bacterium]